MKEASEKQTVPLGSIAHSPSPLPSPAGRGGSGSQPSAKPEARDTSNDRLTVPLSQLPTSRDCGPRAGVREKSTLNLQRFGGLLGLSSLLQKQRSPSSLLGLSLDGSRLEGVVLRRTNGLLQVQKTFTVSLALNPLTGDPELVGREIRNHLDQEGIRERRCALCVPLSLALVLHTQVPDLPEPDTASFLQIEAERGFPYGPDALHIATSRLRSAGGEQHATLVAVPRNHVAQLEKALKAAQLKLASFTLGVTTLQSADKESSRGVLALAIGESNVDLQVTCGGGVAALRSLEGALDTEGSQKRLDADVLAREIRITLGQLPAEFRDAVRRVRVFARGESVHRHASDLMPRLEAMGLQVEPVKAYSKDDFASQLPAGTAMSPAVSLAARHLTGVGAGFEFLPPTISPWERLTSRFSSKKLMWASAAAGAVAFVVAVAFLAQQWQLSRLGSKWAAMEAKVNELDAMQQQIKQFRPWFDDSFKSLSILRKLTEAFPEDGEVSAKTLEIRELSTVSCTGTARDTKTFLKMLDRLRAIKEVANVKVPQIRGNSPLQFTFDFQWGEGAANEN